MLMRGVYGSSGITYPISVDSLGSQNINDQLQTQLKSTNTKTVTLAAGVLGWSSWISATMMSDIAIFLENTGANAIQSFDCQIASGLNGTGVVVSLANKIVALAPGGTIYIPAWDSTWGSWGCCHDRLVCYSLRVGATSAAGTLLTTAFIGNKR